MLKRLFMRLLGELARAPASRDERVLRDGDRRVPGGKGHCEGGVYQEAQLQLPHLELVNRAAAVVDGGRQGHQAWSIYHALLQLHHRSRYRYLPHRALIRVPGCSISTCLTL